MSSSGDKSNVKSKEGVDTEPAFLLLYKHAFTGARLLERVHVNLTSCQVLSNTDGMVSLDLICSPLVSGWDRMIN